MQGDEFLIRFPSFTSAPSYLEKKKESFVETNIQFKYMQKQRGEKEASRVQTL